MSVTAASTAAVCGLAAPVASADAIGYLAGVTVRSPGYDFAGVDQALAYGYGLCDKIGSGTPYAQLVANINSDFDASDEFQASYLLSQAAAELCPDLISQLRTSAGGYRPSPN